MTPDDYLRRARELDAEAEQLARAGHIKESVARAIEAEHLRRAAAELRGLSGRAHPRTVHTEMEMTDSHRAALGTSRAGHSVKFRRWIANAEGKRPFRPYSLRRLAEAIKADDIPCSASALSQAQRPRRDHLARPVRPDVAGKVEELTGWPADDAHWPAGFQDE